MACPEACFALLQGCLRLVPVPVPVPVPDLPLTRTGGITNINLLGVLCALCGKSKLITALAPFRGSLNRKSAIENRKSTYGMAPFPAKKKVQSYNFFRAAPPFPHNAFKANGISPKSFFHRHNL